MPARYRGRAVNQAMGQELAHRATAALADSVFLQLAARTRVDAQHNLRELAGDDARIRLLGNIRDRERVSSTPTTKNGAPALKVSFRVPMRGVDGVVANLYDRVITMPSTGQPGARTSHDAEEPILFVDARGTGARPALFPRIVDTEGELVYDASVAGREKAVEQGIVEYVVIDPSAHARLPVVPGARFIRAVGFQSDAYFHRTGGKGKKRKKRKVVRASRAAGLRKANIIVGSKEAGKIKAKGRGWLKKARVIVVTDSALGGTEGRLPQRLHYAVRD